MDKKKAALTAKSLKTARAASIYRQFQQQDYHIVLVQEPRNNKSGKALMEGFCIQASAMLSPSELGAQIAINVEKPFALTSLLSTLSALKLFALKPFLSRAPDISSTILPRHRHDSRTLN